MKNAEKIFNDPIPKENKLAVLEDLASQAIANGCLEDLEVFLRYGADANAYLLGLALKKESEEISRLLIEHKANVKDLLANLPEDFKDDRAPLKLLEKILTDMGKFEISDSQNPREDIVP